MKRSEEEQLLRDILADETVSRLRESSLAQGLSVVRARRRQIRARRIGFTACLTLMLILAVTWVRPRVKEPTAGPASVSTSATERRGVELIDDDQLLALFPHRHVALIGAPGNQKLIFLDGGSTQVAGRENR